MDEALYVWGDPESGWGRRVAEPPNDVRVRVGDNVCELRATKVNDASEKKRVVAAYHAKSAESLDEIFVQPVTIDFLPCWSSIRRPPCTSSFEKPGPR